MNPEMVTYLRCKRCNKKPRGKMAQRNLDHYHPFCSYRCQVYYNLEEAQAHLTTLREEGIAITLPGEWNDGDSS